MIIPDERVPLAFRQKVLGELAAARDRALEILPLPLRTVVRVGSRHAPDQVQIVRLGRPGRCVGCGGPHRLQTPGCKTCMGRHSMRRQKARRAA